MGGFAIGYTGGDYDRACERRLDDAWIAAEIAAARCRIVPVWRDRNLVSGWPDAAPRAAFLNSDAARALLADPANGAILLGVDTGGAVFALDVSGRDEAEAAFGLGAYAEIRGLSALLPPAEAALLATARGLCHWHRTHRFCGACGHPTESREVGHSRLCTDPACARQHYPRLDPAVIMLVESVDAAGRPVCLLAHNARFPGNVFSTLAGFVEIGETLEQAVRREVMEEVGCAVAEVSYRASQPWPFPSSIMLGFRATAAFAPLKPDAVEVSDARWFTAADLDAAAEWEEEGAALRLPRRDSIARFLIEGWRAERARP
ncbi:Peroxisomal NADH pyrophosphatase [uncultured Alphaproteobacteria bacterium]|uniref:NAD(+) diphosphatase n=1 Tax=uncultured Alphaproteobacteria bacterium TaxID=91750 RepID=A0A212KN35_9PROT|nr:Peroxisomal NADH pyrophosphatase [uncultured Alphaproteobacteria bacterium]